MRELPPELEQERQALMLEIRDAFAGVTRGEATSWHETFVLDDYGVSKGRNRDRARSADRDTSWLELASNESWVPGPGVGGFVFLDAVAYRYYLPAAMISFLQTGHDAFPSFDPESLADSKDQTSILDERQLACLLRFLAFIQAHDKVP